MRSVGRCSRVPAPGWVVSFSFVVKHTSSEEVGWLGAVGPPLVWQRLCEACGADSYSPPLSPSDLRSTTMSASYVAVSYIGRKLWRVADTLRWSLAEGGIKANHLQLKRPGYDGTDALTLELHRLLVGGFSGDCLVEAVELVRYCPWSTVIVEQVHGSMVVIHQFQSMLTQEVLAHRTLVHRCRALFHLPQEELRRTTC